MVCMGSNYNKCEEDQWAWKILDLKLVSGYTVSVHISCFKKIDIFHQFLAYFKYYLLGT